MQFDLLTNNLKPHRPSTFVLKDVRCIFLLFHNVPSSAYKAVLIPKSIPICTTYWSVENWLWLEVQYVLSTFSGVV